MNWSKGYTSACYVTVVDPVTWRDTDRIEITGGSVSRSKGELMESATLECVDYDQQTERWVRVWLDTIQDGAAAHIPVFTGLATSPDRDINGKLFTEDVECYSVLLPAKDIFLQRGWYAPAGANGAELAAQLLGVTPAPKEVADGAPALSATYIAEDKETHLSMAMKIIEAINWRIRITGDGIIQILPKAAEESASFDCLDNDSLEPELTVGYDWFSVPNVFRAIKDDVAAVARDEDPDSIFSIPSRGREVWMEETNCKLNAAESLSEYSARRLKEEQNVVYTASYDRRFHPDVSVGDLVRLHYPEQDVNGLFEVTKQSIDLTIGGRTAEEGERSGNI